MPEIQVISIGEFVDQEGRKFSISGQDVADMVSAKDEINRDLVVDYNHQTLTAALTGGQAPAAGWIKKLVNKGMDGLFAVVEWTDKAREDIRSGAYKYLSAYIRWDRLAENGKTYRIFLDHAALTNWPWIQDIRAISASAKTQDGDEKHARIAIEIKSCMQTVSALQMSATQTEKGVRTGVSEPRKEKMEMEKLKAFLIRWLGLAEDVADEELEAKALEALAQVTGQGKAEEVAASAKLAGMVPAIRKTLGLKEDASETEITGKIISLTAVADKKSDMEKRMEAAERELSERKRDELVAVALTAGKITPAQKPWADEYALKDPEGFRKWRETAPVVVSLGAASRPPAQKSGGSSLTESEKRSAKAAGVSEEVYRKHNPVRQEA